MPQVLRSAVTSANVRALAPRLVVFALLALAGNALGPILRYPEIGSAVLFTPYATLAAALIVAPRRDWVWFLLIDAAAHLITHWAQWPLSWMLMASVANTARALTAAALVTAWLGRPPRLDSIRTLALFLAGAVVIAPAVGATLGAATVVLHGGSVTYWAPWRAWFISNGLTGLTMLPPLLALFAFIYRPSRMRARRGRMIEWLAFTFALVLAGALMAGRTTGGYATLRDYAPVPLLLWGALRFGVAGAGATLTTLTFAAVFNVAQGTALIGVGSLDDRVLALQTFLVVASLPILCLAAIASGGETAAQLHRALLASREDRVAIVDRDGVVVEVSDSWKRFAERPGLQPFHRVRPGDEYAAACRRAADTGDPIAASLLSGLTRVLTRQNRRVEIEFDETQDGRRKTYLMNIEALQHPDGGAYLVCADITVRQQTELELEDQRRQLSHLSRVAVLGQLSGAFAHELNQPLSAILTNAEAAHQILRREPVDLQTIGDILRDIIADDHRAAAVIARLRALLRRGERKFDRIDLRELIDDVMTLARTELITRQVQVVVRVDPALPSLWGDRIQLHQVLLNLILNACEAMNTSPASDRTLHLAVNFEEGGAHVTVRDRGTGIAPDILERLFEPFLTTKSDGLGLGLSISRTIVAAHGGRLWGENNPDGGATLHCVLPVVTPAGLAAHAAATAFAGHEEA